MEQKPAADLDMLEANSHDGLSGSSIADLKLQEEIAGFLRRKLGAD